MSGQSGELVTETNTAATGVSNRGETKLDSRNSQNAKEETTHVVVVGAGFAGLQVAERLSRSKDFNVTLIDRQNYHLFQPLLYQVATGGLSPANIATPLRAILGQRRNVEIVLGEVVDFDLEERLVILADGRVSFDKLVVASGATHSYFGNDSWQEHAPGLKTVSDAMEIRRRVFLAFEAAERSTREEDKNEWLTFIVVGGGPTGVELAGALSEISRHTLKSDFRHIRPENSRIIMVEAGDSVLDAFPEKLRLRALKSLQKRGIDVRLNTRMTGVAPRYVELSQDGKQQRVPSRTVLWAAGVAASPLGKRIAEAAQVELDRGGRVPVTQRLQLPKNKDVFVIGDLASCKDQDGAPLPGLAPVAIQQGQYVAKLLKADRVGVTLPKEFRYKNKGTMATIGRASAVAHIGKAKFGGFLAWVMWLFIHLMMLVHFQNRFLVLTQWAWNYITFNRSSWLITGLSHPLKVVDRPGETGEDS